MIFLLELMLALGLLGGVVVGLLRLHDVYEMRYEIRKQEVRIKAFQIALERTFSLIVDHIRKNCSDGISTTSCANTYPFPSSVSTPASGGVVVLTYPISLTLPSRSSLVNEVSSLWASAECSVSDSAGTLTVRCADMELNGSYSAPPLIDPSVPPSISLDYIKRGLDGSIIRKNFVASLSGEYDYRRKANEQFFASIANVLREYHLTRRIAEANNPCRAGGGLNSADDLLIPWVMQGYTSGPFQLCNTSTTSSCSCTNITWNTVDQANRNSMKTLLTNLYGGSLPFNIVDYFGNPVYVYAVVNSSDNPVTPPNPSSGYSSSPPYTGLIRLNTSFSCTTAKQPHCYLKFVYPN